MRKQTQKWSPGVTEVVAGSRAPHTILPWLSRSHELRKQQVCCWEFLTGSLESVSSLHIPCPPPSPVLEAEPGLLLLLPGGRESWLPLSVSSPPPPPTHTSQKHLQEWMEAVAGRWGLGKRLLWAGLWGGGRQGCETCLGVVLKQNPKSGL